MSYEPTKTPRYPSRDQTRDCKHRALKQQLAALMRDNVRLWAEIRELREHLGLN